MMEKIPGRSIFALAYDLGYACGGMCVAVAEFQRVAQEHFADAPESVGLVEACVQGYMDGCPLGELE